MILGHTQKKPYTYSHTLLEEKNETKQKRTKKNFKMMRKLSQNKAKKNKPDTPLVLVQLIPEECKKKNAKQTKREMIQNN